MATSQPARSVKEIEADIAASRTRLAGTVDELTYRVSPGTLKAKALASVKDTVDRTAFDADGDLRFDQLAKVLGGVAGVTLTLGVLRRLFHD
jgi:hypothetical protein